ncbi:MAG: alpha-amylase family glycosyl hydrolase [Eubacteriales bacterium]|nr:alpha-amylase family glycosyl hydrolase [Eubacteriales bacterium]
MKRSRVKWLQSALLCLAAYIGLSGCSLQKKTTESKGSVVSSMQMDSLNQRPTVYDDTPFPTSTYEVFLYSFYDSDGDGIGDIRGLIEKLDYINDGKAETTTDLGFRQIWLMPICPSPSYHKYDVTDYCAIDPQYGTMEDFKALVQACHDRGIRLITDLVLNHTSDEHPWFQQAKQYLTELGDGEADPTVCPTFDYYLFDRGNGKPGYKRLENTGWTFDARFTPDMPDLNLDHEAVRAEIAKITDFWLDLGVDGFRLDACGMYYEGDPYKFEKNIAFMTWLHQTITAKKPDAYVVGEAWEDPFVYAQYYASGLSFFDFAFSVQRDYVPATVDGRLDGNWWLKESQRVEQLYDEASDEASAGVAINAPFYTNHDMNRSAGYYPGDDGTKAKFALGLHLLRPGNVFLYYGEELGMKGSGKDENKRAPMYWSETADTKGLCQGPPQMDEVKQKFPAADQQLTDETSIHHYAAQAIHLRNAFPALALGRTDLSDGWNHNQMAVIKRAAKGYETVWLAINFTEQEQTMQVSEKLEIVGTLNIDEKQVTMKDGTLTLPGRHIAVLRERAE